MYKSNCFLKNYGFNINQQVTNLLNISNIKKPRVASKPLELKEVSYAKHFRLNINHEPSIIGIKEEGSETVLKTRVTLKKFGYLTKKFLNKYLDTAKNWSYYLVNIVRVKRDKNFINLKLRPSSVASPVIPPIRFARLMVWNYQLFDHKKYRKNNIICNQESFATNDKVGNGSGEVSGVESGGTAEDAKKDSSSPNITSAGASPSKEEGTKTENSDIDNKLLELHQKLSSNKILPDKSVSGDAISFRGINPSLVLSVPSIRVEGKLVLDSFCEKFNFTNIYSTQQYDKESNSISSLSPAIEKTSNENLQLPIFSPTLKFNTKSHVLGLPETSLSIDNSSNSIINTVELGIDTVSKELTGKITIKKAVESTFLHSSLNPTNAISAHLSTLNNFKTTIQYAGIGLLSHQMVKTFEDVSLISANSQSYKQINIIGLSNDPKIRSNELITVANDPNSIILIGSGYDSGVLAVHMASCYTYPLMFTNAKGNIPYGLCYNGSQINGSLKIYTDRPDVVNTLLTEYRTTGNVFEDEVKLQKALDFISDMLGYEYTTKAIMEIQQVFFLNSSIMGKSINIGVTGFASYTGCLEYMVEQQKKILIYSEYLNKQTTITMGFKGVMYRSVLSILVREDVNRSFQHIYSTDPIIFSNALQEVKYYYQEFVSNGNSLDNFSKFLSFGQIFNFLNSITDSSQDYIDNFELVMKETSNLLALTNNTLSNFSIYPYIGLENNYMIKGTISEVLNGATLFGIEKAKGNKFKPLNQASYEWACYLAIGSFNEYPMKLKSNYLPITGIIPENTETFYDSGVNRIGDKIGYIKMSLDLVNLQYAAVSTFKKLKPKPLEMKFEVKPNMDKFKKTKIENTKVVKPPEEETIFDEFGRLISKIEQVKIKRIKKEKTNLENGESDVSNEPVKVEIDTVPEFSENTINQLVESSSGMKIAVSTRTKYGEETTWRKNYFDEVLLTVTAINQYLSIHSPIINGNLNPVSIRMLNSFVNIKLSMMFLGKIVESRFSLLRPSLAPIIANYLQSTLVNNNPTASVPEMKVAEGELKRLNKLEIEDKEKLGFSNLLLSSFEHVEESQPGIIDISYANPYAIPYNTRSEFIYVLNYANTDDYKKKIKLMVGIVSKTIGQQLVLVNSTTFLSEISKAELSDGALQTPLSRQTVMNKIVQLSLILSRLRNYLLYIPDCYYEVLLGSETDTVLTKCLCTELDIILINVVKSN